MINIYKLQRTADRFKRNLVQERDTNGYRPLMGQEELNTITSMSRSITGVTNPAIHVTPVNREQHQAQAVLRDFSKFIWAL